MIMAEFDDDIQLYPDKTQLPQSEDIKLLTRIADQLAIIAGVSLMDIGRAVRVTNDATSKEIPVPEFARVFVCHAEVGDVRLDIDTPATSTSTLRVIQDSWFTHPIRYGQHLYSYGAAGTFTDVRFIGFGGKL